MSGALGNLLIKLTADTGEATGDIGKAAHQIERDMQSMATKATAAGAAIGIAVTAIGAAFVGAARDALTFGDTLSKMSQRTGLAVERLSELSFAAQLSDVSMGSLGQGLSQFNKMLVEAEKEGSRAARMFDALGVDINAGPRVAFEQMAKAINALPDGETKVATMRAAFGRAGDALIPMMSGLDDASTKARELGLVLSEQMAKDSERFNDAMTTLATAGRSLAINALEPVSKWLADVAEGFVKARTNGNLFKNALIETSMLLASLWGGLAEQAGITSISDLMESEFRRLKKLQDEMNGTGFKKITVAPSGINPGGLDGDAGDNRGVNREALNRALANIRDPKTKTPKIKADPNLAGNQWQWWMEEEAKINAEAAAATDKYNQTLRDQAEIAAKADMASEIARAKAVEQMQEILDQQTRMAHGWDENGRKIVDNTKKVNDFAREMGLTFTSAFEDAIIEGKKLSDVLKGLAQDIARIAVRKSVTEPLGGMISEGIKGIFGGGSFGGAGPDSTWGGIISNLFGGGSGGMGGLDGALGDAGGFWSSIGFLAEGGPAQAGHPYIVGEQGPELFVPDVSGTVVPNGAMGNSYYIDARGADAAAVARIESALVRLAGPGVVERRALSAVRDTRVRGGSPARGLS